VENSRIPLSFSQERLWFTDRLEGSLQYHIPTVLRLNGAVDIAGLRHALGTIVGRHEVLRTVFIEDEAGVYQHLKQAEGWELETVNGSGYKEDAEGLEGYIKRLIRKPFDLSKDYMLRAVLIQLEEQDYVLLVTLHHIASDAWSTSVIVKEVVELYSSWQEGRQSQLLPLWLQYSDYAIWQRNYLQGKVLDDKVGYWKEKLEGVVPLDLPVDYDRSLISGKGGAVASLRIEKEISLGLKHLSKQWGCSLFMTLLAAFKVLLHRYSGQQDICVGTSIASRPQKELEGLVGFFVNTLALRDEVRSDMSFTDLLEQVRVTTMGAYEHQEVPFEKVVEVVAKERDTGRSLLFQVMLVFANTPEVSQLKLGEVQLSSRRYESNLSKFEITFFITDTGNGLHITAEYSTELYSRQTIERMLGHYKELLSVVIKLQGQKIGDLRMLSVGEELELVKGFNSSSVEYPEERSIVSLFEEQVEKTPEASAVVFAGEELSYRELNRRANQLSHYLRQKGVREDTLVGLCVDKGIDMMVGMLGILKAAGAYVPVDTGFPAERIGYMLGDAGVSIVVSNSQSSIKLEGLADVAVIELDEDCLALSNQAEENIVPAAASGNLAYVIYTSGSTGNPKGVMIEHRSVVDYVFGLNEKVQADQCKSFALVSTIATDLGNTVIYSSLLTGGALHLFSKGSVSDIEYLHKYFREHRIDCLKIVPSHWKSLSDGDDLLLPEKLLVFGGEALQTALIERISLTGTLCKVVNHYGPTETTIGKLLHRVDMNRRYNKTIPVGKPFSNTAVYILSKELQLCPVGVGGQLYISGDGLARGYLNNEALTKSRFIKNPFSKGGSNKLMYATGDLVKYLPGGDIEFIGRVDDQVKIRGYRVELGEIESILQQSDLVSQGVVLGREDKQGNRRLVGYIVAQGQYDKEGIVSYLHGKLPEYMIPSVLVQVEQLPLTANGKVDRKALPDPDMSEMLSGQYAAPQSEVEKVLAGIWQDILEVDQVGVHDDFFELGGHSLLAMRLISEVRRKFAVGIEIKDLFHYVTISKLSKYLEVRVGISTEDDFSPEFDMLVI
jgi:amino acid adenylation domain-containing protein